MAYLSQFRGSVDLLKGIVRHLLQPVEYPVDGYAAPPSQVESFAISLVKGKVVGACHIRHKDKITLLLPISINDCRQDA